MNIPPLLCLKSNSNNWIAECVVSTDSGSVLSLKAFWEGFLSCDNCQVVWHLWQAVPQRVPPLRQRSLLYNTRLSQSRERAVTIETDTMFIWQMVTMITRCQTLFANHIFERWVQSLIVAFCDFHAPSKPLCCDCQVPVQLCISDNRVLQQRWVTS
jgi:hypothetical protein